MQVAASRRTGPVGAGLSAGSGAGAALASSLTMYVDPPREDLTLEDFEVAALDRLKREYGLSLRYFVFVPGHWSLCDGLQC